MTSRCYISLLYLFQLVSLYVSLLSYIDANLKTKTVLRIGYTYLKFIEIILDKKYDIFQRLYAKLKNVNI